MRTCLRKIFSITLLRTEVRDIGRLLLGKDLSPDLKTGIIAAFFKEVGIRLEERECEKIIFKAGAISSAQLIRREAVMPSGPPAEFGESSLIASIIIESERVISVRNKSSSRVVCERKNVTGSLITDFYNI